MSDTSDPHTPSDVGRARVDALAAATRSAKAIDLDGWDNLGMYLRDETNRALASACDMLFEQSGLFDAYGVVPYIEESDLSSWDAQLVLVADNGVQASGTMRCRILGVDLSDYRDMQGIMDFVERVAYELDALVARDAPDRSLSITRWVWDTNLDPTPRTEELRLEELMDEYGGFEDSAWDLVEQLLANGQHDDSGRDARVVYLVTDRDALSRQAAVWWQSNPQIVAQKGLERP